MINELESMKESLISHVGERADSIAREKMRTEADLIMIDVGIMAQMTINDSNTWLKEGTHYVIKGTRIYFDLPVMFVTYRLFKTSCREKLVIEDPDQFKQLISQEPYFITANSVDGAKALKINRAVLELDLERMADKGLDRSMYG